MKKSHTLSRLIALLLAVMMMFALTACGSKQEAPKPAEEGSATAESETDAEPAEKVLKIGELWAITSLSLGTTTKEKILVTETLVNVDPNFKLVPALATDWENVDDLHWVFNLRDDVTFHDGSKMDADAVVWAIMSDIEKNPTLVTNNKIEKAEATGEYQVTITTSVPNAELPEYMEQAGMSIVTPDSYDAEGNMVLPIGTGPFKMESFDVSTGVVTIVRNDDYYGDKPSLDKVTLTGMTDANTRANALESGEIDFTCDLPFNQIERLDALDNVRVELYDTARVYAAKLNCNGFFGDKLVRQAVSLAIDRETISSKVLFGAGTPAKNIYTPNMAWCDTNIDASTFDLEKAKDLMAQAGWADSDGDGILDKDGQPFTFTIITYTERPGLPLIAEALQAQLKELGMDVKVSTMENSAINDEMAKGEWGMYLAGLATAQAPSSVWFMNNNYNEKSLSDIGYSNPKFTELLDKCTATFDTEGRYAISKEIQALAMEELPMIYVCNYGCAYGFNEKVQNFVFNPTAHDYMWNTDIEIVD